MKWLTVEYLIRGLDSSRPGEVDGDINVLQVQKLISFIIKHT